MKSRFAFRCPSRGLAVLALILLLSPAAVHAAGTGEHVFRQDAQGNVQPAPDAAPLLGQTTSFSVSPEHLRATRRDSRTQLDVEIDARPGQDVDLRTMTKEEFLVDLNRVLLETSRNLLDQHPAAEGRQLAPVVPDGQGEIGRRTARASVDEGSVDVTLDLSPSEAGAPEQQIDSSSQLDFLDPDVSGNAAETCSGICDENICLCEGTLDCCATGCAICFILVS